MGRRCFSTCTPKSRYLHEVRSSNVLCAIDAHFPLILRYLTNICDQVIALISDDHAKSMLWSNSLNDDQLSDPDEDDTDRLFTFEVAKTKEQEEGVTVRQGFEACYRCYCSIPHPCINDYAPLIRAPLMSSSSPNFTQSAIWTPSFSNHACCLVKRDKDL